MLLLRKMLKYYTRLILSLALVIGACQDATSFEKSRRPLPSPNPSTSVTETAYNPSLHSFEQSIHQQVNQYRQSQNLLPLRLDSTLSQQARLHSQAMAQGRVPFSHQGFDQRIEVISQALPYLSVAENLATNRGYNNPSKQAVSGWLESQGHYTNLIGDYNLTGIGVARDSLGKYYFTQIFVKSR